MYGNCHYSYLPVTYTILEGENFELTKSKTFKPYTYNEKITMSTRKSQLKKIQRSSQLTKKIGEEDNFNNNNNDDNDTIVSQVTMKQNQTKEYK